MLKGIQIYLRGFGSFYLQIVKEKRISNKFTNGEYMNPEHMKYKFKFTKYFIENINDEEEIDSVDGDEE